ncbi:MAG: AAA family ATPase [Magnetospiraceae bacterium]
MRVIAVVSQKGGSGKTTLSGHIAVQAVRAGDGPVAIIDTDPQGSLADWWNERRDEQPYFVRTSLAELRDHVEALRHAGVKVLILDTPPAITMAIQEVIEVADHVIIPTRPSPHDLRAVGATVRLVERVNKPMFFVVNDATPRARITSEAAIALSQHGTVAPVTIHHRTDFAASMIDGRTVMELNPNTRSSREISDLWEYITARMDKIASKTVFHQHVTPDGPVEPPKAVHQPAPAAPMAPPVTPTPAPVTTPTATPTPEAVPVAATAEQAPGGVLPFDALVSEQDRHYMSPSWVANTGVEPPPQSTAKPQPTEAAEPAVPTAPRPGYHRPQRGFGRRQNETT